MKRITHKNGVYTTETHGNVSYAVTERTADESARLRRLVEELDHNKFFKYTTKVGTRRRNFNSWTNSSREAAEFGRVQLDKAAGQFTITPPTLGPIPKRIIRDRRPKVLTTGRKG